MKKEKEKTVSEEEINTPETEEKKEKENEKEVSETEKLKKELSEKEDKFLRICAEYDNFRKRSSKEKQDIYVTSKTDIIKELLPILDNFERADANPDADYETYKKGVELIYNQFLQILEKFNVKAYGAEGETFDPNIHSAVMTVEDESLGENVIAQVFSKGYKLGDKIIREAVVKVANS